MTFQDHGLEELFSEALCGGLRSKEQVIFGKVLDHKIRTCVSYVSCGSDKNYLGK